MSMPAVKLEPATARPAGEPVWPDVRADANRIKLSWLIRLHWGGIVGQTLAIVSARWIIDIDVPLLALLALVGFEIALNIGLEIWLRRAPRIRDRGIAVTMLFDAVILTA